MILLGLHERLLWMLDALWNFIVFGWIDDDCHSEIQLDKKKMKPRVHAWFEGQNSKPLILSDWFINHTQTLTIDGKPKIKFTGSRPSIRTLANEATSSDNEPINPQSALNWSLIHGRIKSSLSFIKQMAIDSNQPPPWLWWVFVIEDLEDCWKWRQNWFTHNPFGTLAEWIL